MLVNVIIPRIMLAKTVAYNSQNYAGTLDFAEPPFLTVTQENFICT